MSKVFPFPESASKPDPAPIDPTRQKVIEAIKLLLGTLSPEQQECVLDEIAETIRRIPAPRAGKVLGAIVRTLPRRVNWSIEQIKQEVAAQGVAATDKEVYNSVGYLTRRKHIRRVGYGAYLYEGGLLTTADDLGLEPTRYEED
jgi:hypothetical protein